MSNNINLKTKPMDTLKEVKVIMLPTEKETDLQHFGISIRRRGQHVHPSLVDYVNLYFISEDKIEEGDWVIAPHLGKQIAVQVKGISKTGMAIHGTVAGFLEAGCKLSSCKKIIATTDPELKLPSPSTAFIEKFCKLGGIDRVLVEYEAEECGIDNGQILYDFDNSILKVSSYNEITIHPIKNSWSREEVIALCFDAMEYGFNGSNEGNNGECNYLDQEWEYKEYANYQYQFIQNNL